MARFSVPTARAEMNGGVLLGDVIGPSGDPIAEARIRLCSKVDVSRCSETVANAAGQFSFIGIPPGSFEVAVRTSQGEAAARTLVDVRSGSTIEMAITVPSASPGRFRVSARARTASRDAVWGTEWDVSSLRRLPNTGNVWSLLESQEPTTATNRIDVGGLKSGEPALFGALGSSWTENLYSLNGLNVTDPFLPGRPLIEPDLLALSELESSTGVKPSVSEGSGVRILLATPEPGGAFHGATRWFYTGKRLQGNNHNARLTSFGFPGPERFDHFVDGGAELGGRLPFGGARWPFFTSLSTQQLSKTIGGFAATIDTHVYRALVEISPLVGDRGRLNLLYSVQHVFGSHEDADPRVAPSATTRGNHNYHQFLARAQRSLNANTWLSIGFGVAHAIVSSGTQPGLDLPSTTNLPTVVRTGAALFSLVGARTRYQADGLVRAVRDGKTGSHSLSLGAGWQRSYISNRWDSLGGFAQTLVEGVGAEVTQWNTPTEARMRVQNIGAFAEDAWRPLRWLRLRLGLRFDDSTGKAPATPLGIHWTTIQPRTALIVPLRQRGPTLRASWSRYGHLLQGRYLDFGNPSALGGEVRRWIDSSGDALAQPAEVSTALRVFGGPHSALDRGLARPFTDEISVGLDQDLGRGFRTSVRFFRRDSHRLIALSNLGVPAADYTPVQVRDPGNDGIPGNNDDQLLTLYNRNPSALGQDFLLLTNLPGDHASFKGFEIRLGKPLARLWGLSASFTAMQTLAATNPGNSVYENDTGFVGDLGIDPNTFLYATSRTYFDRAFIGKASGYYSAPRGFLLGFVAKYYDGLPFGRLLFVDGFNQGPFFVRTTPRAHPGGFQTQFNMTFDIRVAKDFALRRGKISAYLDLFNALNLNNNTLEADLTGPTFESRVPMAIQAPRVARLGIEWKF